MARLRGPYSVAFPVNFTSKGDTTRDAFRKHMDEITRIYGILTGLDAETMDADSVGDILQKHIDSTNPHPKWKPSMSFSDLSGTLDASKVIGKLTGATIDGGNVNGLEALVKDISSGITYSDLKDNGYIKFANGLLVQWGTFIFQKDSSGSPRVQFTYKFNQECFAVTIVPIIDYAQLGATFGNSYAELLAKKITVLFTLERNSLSTDGFRYHYHFYSEASDGDTTISMGNVEPFTFINFIALGV